MGAQRIPVPTEAVQKIHSRLAPHYGSEVWSDSTHKVLLIRVPKSEPDPVNDVEMAIDYLTPSDVEGMTHCLLLGNQRIHLVPPGPLRQLMAARQSFDHQQVAGLRERLPANGHVLYRAPEDPRRKWRLAVRLAKESVKELEDEDLEILAETIGPELESSAMKQACAVYLVAGKDYVRLEPEMFVQELLRTWKDEERRRRIESDRRRSEEEAHRKAEQERRALLRDLDSRVGSKQRVAAAPVRKATDLQKSPMLEQSTQVVARAPPRTTEAPSGDALDRLHARLDALRTHDGPKAKPPAVRTRSAVVPAVAPRQRYAAAPAFDQEVDEPEPESAPEPAPPLVPTAVAPAQAQPPARSVGWERDEPAPASPKQRLAQRLGDEGYDVRLDPPVDPPLDLAAERTQEPGRLVVRFLDCLNLAWADQVLRQARELAVDRYVVVAPEADEGGQRKIVASKVRWVRPDDLDQMDFLRA